MNKREKILLIDFSKVVSPIWISRHLSTCLSDFVNLPKDEIRNMYKQHIWSLVKGKYSISVFLEELIPYLKDGYSADDLLEASKIVPPLDEKFLEWVKVLKKTHYVYLVSDVHEVLGESLREKLKEYFDDFVFSFEEKAKKSEDIFWQNLSKKIDFSKVELFVDDKEENIKLAEKYGIRWLVYDETLWMNIVMANVYSHKDYYILWAWAAWIIFSYNLLKYTKKSFWVLEKESQPYWLMKSFRLSNSRCDLWWHALHDSDKKIIQYINTQWSLESYRQRRKAYVDYQGTFIPFPFQLHLSYLDKKQRNRCVLDLLNTYFKLKWKKLEINDLDSFLLVNFWKSIYNTFLKPYNEKLWKMNLKKISSNWCNRILFKNIALILKWAYVKNDKNYWTNSYVNYPKIWWFENYLVPFFSKIKEFVQFGVNITDIDMKYHLIYTDNWVLHYEKLISTIPLNELLNLSHVVYNKELFEYLSLQIFSVIVPKIKNQMQRIYLHDKDYFFHKCTLNSNSSLSQQNQNESVIQFETTFKDWKSIDRNEFEKNCIDYAKKIWLINSRDDILVKDYKEVKYWYPIQILDPSKQKDSYLKTFIENQIFPIWRFWAWNYCNFDKIIHDVNDLFKVLENEDFIF